MPRTKRAAEEHKIRCETCLKEIPRTEALSPEGSEYVMNFCGLDCYETWLKSTQEVQPEEPASKDA